jgi:hypothetical protein
MLDRVLWVTNFSLFCALTRGTSLTNHQHGLSIRIIRVRSVIPVVTGIRHGLNLLQVMCGFNLVHFNLFHFILI